jgi:trans-2,3-dihydro-3-hydroxyanthranilate isomerase
VVSTGAAHLLVPLVDRAAVDGAVPDPGRLAAVLADAGGEGCYVFTTAAADADDGAHAYARFFNPTMGIGEDPATGTAAGPLAATLVRSGHVEPGTPVVIEQGHRIGRPSRIRIDVDGERVRLSGSGIVVAEGQLTLP